MKTFLKIANKIVEKRSNIPVLHCMQINDDKYTVTNCNIFVKYIGEKTKQKKLVDFKVFNKLYSNKNAPQFQDNEIIFNKLRLKYSDLEADDFSEPLSELEEPIEINKEWLQQAIASLSHAMSNEEVKYYLNGVFFDKKQAVATDGHRMVIYKYKGFKIKQPFIMPKEIVKLLPSLKGNAFLSLAKNLNKSMRHEISFPEESISVNFKAIGGKYPEYSRVIPDNYPIFDLEVSKIKEAYKEIKLIEGTRIAHQAIKITKEGLFWENSDGISYADETLINIKHQTGFNISYLNELASIFDEDAVISFSQDPDNIGAPAKYVTKQATYVLMPMRV